MKFTIALLSLVAGLAIATPAAMPESAQADSLEARAKKFDCKKCRCSSAEKCTFFCCQ